MPIPCNKLRRRAGRDDVAIPVKRDGVAWEIRRLLNLIAIVH